MKFEYRIGDIVYLSTDPDQHKRIVTAINIRHTGVQFELSCGDRSSWHYGIEISMEKDVLITSDN